MHMNNSAQTIKQLQIHLDVSHQETQDLQTDMAALQKRVTSGFFGDMSAETWEDGNARDEEMGLPPDDAGGDLKQSNAGGRPQAA